MCLFISSFFISPFIELSSSSSKLFWKEHNQSILHPLPTEVVSLQFHNNFQDFQGTLTHKNQKSTRCTVLSSNIWESERGYGEQVSAKPVSDLDGWTREWIQNDSKWPNKPTKVKVENCSSDSLDLCGMWFHVISCDFAWFGVNLGDFGWFWSSKIVHFGSLSHLKCQKCSFLKL